MELCPITLEQANEYIESEHRHHGKVVGHKFSIGLHDGEKIIGVIIIGRPVARYLDDEWTAEVTRCCTNGTQNACSKLYSAAWRACRAMGYKRLITYILESEKGTSLKAANWKVVAETSGGSWDCKARPRIDKHPTCPKKRWEIGLPFDSKREYP